MSRRMLGIALALATTAQAAVAAPPPPNVQFLNSSGVRGSPTYIADVGAYSGKFIPGGSAINWYCVDFGNGIAPGQKFAAYITGLTSSTFVQGQTRFGNSFASSALALKAYQQASFLTAFFAVNPKAEWDDIHSAIWSIFDPSTPIVTFDPSHPLRGKGTQYWVDFAANWYHTYDYSNVVIITDIRAAGKGVCGHVSSICGFQEFVTGPPTVVPEPMSMTLLGTGLAGVFAAGRRRRKQNKV